MSESTESGTIGASRFAGKVCVIAGAGQGIGSATAKRFAQEGGTLLLGDWVEESVGRLGAELAALGANVETHTGNYAVWEDCQSLVAKAIASFGRIDVLVVIVGGTIFYQSFQHYSPEQIVAEVDKSLWPVLWCTRAALPHMIERRSGSIVTLSSHAVVGKFRVPYAAAKAGVAGVTFALSKEAGRYGVRINSVAPSAAAAGDRVTPRNHRVDAASSALPDDELQLQKRYREVERRSTQPLTEFLGRDSTAEEQAAAIAFLASDDASFITGQVISVGGGETMPF